MTRGQAMGQVIHTVLGLALFSLLACLLTHLASLVCSG